MNQVYFYHSQEDGECLPRPLCLNPFMNQVYFYKDTILANEYQFDLS